MKAEDKKRFAEAFIGTWELHGKTPAPEAVKLAFNALSDFSLEDVLYGLQKHIRDPECGQFIPKPADIVRQINGSHEDKAMRAWPLFERGIRGGYSGSGKYVVFDDPTMHMVMKSMGGFAKYGRRNESDMPFIKKEFIQEYVMYSAFPTEDYPTKIPTSDQLQHSPDRVLHIGDANKCAQIENRKVLLDSPIMPARLTN